MVLLDNHPGTWQKQAQMPDNADTHGNLRNIQDTLYWKASLKIITCRQPMSYHRPYGRRLLILLSWVVSSEIHLQNHEACPGCWADSQGLRDRGSEPSSGSGGWSLGLARWDNMLNGHATLSQAVSPQTCDFPVPGASGATLSSDSHSRTTCHYLPCMGCYPGLMSRKDAQTFTPQELIFMRKHDWENWV